jgi:uncharacterized damage-inducible protein DinB
MSIGRPNHTEAAEYYFKYIDQVGPGDIRDILETQAPETLSLLQEISDSQSLHRYAPDKWTIRQTVSHLSDVERLYVSRAFWFARGFDSELPSFDQHTAVAAAGADERPWRAHMDEFRDVRAATVSFFRNLPEQAWSRRGIASGNPFSVRALAYITAGHVVHHNAILRQQYLAGAPMV